MYSESFKLKCVQYYIENKETLQEVADRFGIGRRSLGRWYNQYKTLDELEDKTPLGHTLKGVSVLLDNEGKVKQQWVKTDKKLESAKEILMSAFDAMSDNITREDPKPYTGIADNDLCSLYVITDYHFGMYAWEGETGEAWDLEIAEKTLIDWFRKAIDSTPKSHTAIFGQLGDFLHYDGLEQITPTGKHVLDASSKFPEIVASVIRVTRIIIEMLLEKHENVHIIMAEGNHDLASSVWLRAMMQEKYMNEPRVTVDNTHIPYYCYVWGDVSLFFHHGHKNNVQSLPSVLASVFREEYGSTKFSYCHSGHMHHKQKESGMMVAEQHQTLSAKDSYAVRGGYNSQRSASVITYHKNHGEVSRITIRPEILGG